MDKTTGYELIINDVNGFSGAKAWIYRLIHAGIVKCGQCDQPATHVFWQDQAEWYVRCDVHREYGEMWTGSTRWKPSSFSLNVLKEPARAWFRTLDSVERQQLRVRKYDATDYYKLMTETETRHYLVGSGGEGYSVYVDITLLTNGEYCYQMVKDWRGGNFGNTTFEAIQGAWPTEAEALAAARAEMEVPVEADEEGE